MQYENTNELDLVEALLLEQQLDADIMEQELLNRYEQNYQMSLYKQGLKF